MYKLITKMMDFCYNNKVDVSYSFSDDSLSIKMYKVVNGKDAGYFKMFTWKELAGMYHETDIFIDNTLEQMLYSLQNLNKEETVNG